MPDEITVTLVTPDGERTMKVRVHDSATEVDEHGRPARVVRLGSGPNAFEWDAEMMDGGTIYANGAKAPGEWVAQTPEQVPAQTKRTKK